jgi:hypothetical protein
VFGRIFDWNLARSLFNGGDNVRALFLEVPEIQVLDVLSERHFPRLLLLVVEFSEFLGIQAQLPRHLNLPLEILDSLKAAPTSTPTPHSDASAENGFSHSCEGRCKVVGIGCVPRRPNVPAMTDLALSFESDPEATSRNISIRSRTMLLPAWIRGKVWPQFHIASVGCDLLRACFP